MEDTGWNKTEFRNCDDLDKFAWYKGFFHYSEDYKIWKRNFRELKLRDISILTLGELEGKKILDIGCGEGLYVLTFLKMGASYVAGQDLSRAAIEKAIAFCKENGYSCDAKEGDCTQLLFENNTFDSVFAGDIFEHITEEQKDKCIKEIFRILKPGGVVTIKTPNLHYLKLSIFFKRMSETLKFRNPFKIHIWHTRNNPTSEHHGLTTYKKLRKLFLNNVFHEPVITYCKLERKRLPDIISRIFTKNIYFNEHIIMTARKPVFFGLYDKL